MAAAAEPLPGDRIRSLVCSRICPGVTTLLLMPAGAFSSPAVMMVSL